MLGERFLYDAKPVISLDERQIEARNRVIREQEDPNGHIRLRAFAVSAARVRKHLIYLPRRIATD